MKYNKKKIKTNIKCKKTWLANEADSGGGFIEDIYLNVNLKGPMTCHQVWCD